MPRLFQSPKVTGLPVTMSESLTANQVFPLRPRSLLTIREKVRKSSPVRTIPSQRVIRGRSKSAVEFRKSKALGEGRNRTKPDSPGMFSFLQDTPIDPAGFTGRDGDPCGILECCHSQPCRKWGDYTSDDLDLELPHNYDQVTKVSKEDDSVMEVQPILMLPPLFFRLCC